MADELQEALGEEATLIPGSGGVFDVVVEGELIFSKFMTGRFPDPGEITGKLKG